MPSPFFDTAASGSAVLVSETGVERLQLVARAGTSTFLCGGSRETGQLPSGPNPYDLMSTALGTCTLMTIRLYAEKSGIPLERAEVRTTHRRGKGDQPDVFERVLRFEGDLTDQQKRTLFDVANCCPVGKSLARGSEMKLSLFDGTASAEPASEETTASTAFQYMDDIYELAMMMLKTSNY